MVWLANDHIKLSVFRIHPINKQQGFWDFWAGSSPVFDVGLECPHGEKQEGGTTFHMGRVDGYYFHQSTGFVQGCSPKEGRRKSFISFFPSVFITNIKL